MVELQPSKLAMGVRFPSPALRAPVAKGTEQRTSNPRKYVHGCQLRSSKTSYLSGIRLRALLRVCHSLVSTADLLLTRCRLEGNDSGTAIPACPGLFRQSCKVNAANFSCGMFSEVQLRGLKRCSVRRLGLLRRCLGALFEGTVHLLEPPPRVVIQATGQ
jgi:hypothetical protein